VGRVVLPAAAGLDAADIAPLVMEDPDRRIPMSVEIIPQQLGLPTAELEQQRAPRAQPAWCTSDNATQEVGAVGAAEVGERRLEGECVSLEVLELGLWDVRDDRGQDIDSALEARRDRGT
jgi:hypothetical protein